MKKLVANNLHLSFEVIALFVCGVAIFAYSGLTEALSQSELVLKTALSMEQIVTHAGEIQNRQFTDLKERENAVDSNAQRVRSVVLYGGCATVTCIILLFLLVQGLLKDLTDEGRLAARSLGKAVEQILDSTSLQAASCNEQATALAEARAALQKMNRSGLQMAEQSGEMVERASKAAAENALSLNERTLAAREIAATVNEIAQQSHLLALNAAIQAAAAGEQGLAFVAVAAEIKSLADQSRDASQQMRSILSGMQKSIHTSVLLSEEAIKGVWQDKRPVEAASESIREVNGSVRQSVYADAQQTAFQRVTQAFQTIDRAGEQTAAGTRQLERSAINLRTLGRQLAQVVERY